MAVCVKEGVSVPVEMAVLVSVAVPEKDGVEVLLGVPVKGGDVVPLDVCVSEALGVHVADVDDVLVVEEELVGSAVREPVLVTLLDAVEDGVALLVIDGEGDEERLRMVAMLRPR